MLYTILITTAFIVLLIIILIDLFFVSRSFFQRLKIGKWTNKNDWFYAITTINLKWLKKTPTVKLTDNSAYIVKDLLKGKYRSTTIQSWQEAGSLLGAIYTENTSPKIDAFIRQKIDIKTGKWIHKPDYVDGAMLAYALVKTNVSIDKFKPALDEVLDLILNHKGEDGTVCYRNFMPYIRFVDTIGFICPFLTYYGQKFNKPEYVDLAILQIKKYIDVAFLKDKWLPAHAFDLDKKVPLGIYGWGRGLGWFILGITDTYFELDDAHPEKTFVKDVIINTATDALEFQKENGSFNAMMAVGSSRHDSSITCLAGWLFFTAFTITNDKKFLKAAQLTLESLMKVTRRNGIIDFCQGDTKGIGHYATTFDVMPFVQGLTIRLAKSIEKYS